MLRAKWYGNLVAFLIPIYFVTNLYGYVSEFTPGILNYHSYLLALCVFALVIASTGKSALKFPRDMSWFLSFYLVFFAVCLLSLLLVSNDENAFYDFTAYTWMALLSSGYLLVFRFDAMHRAAAFGFFVSFLLMVVINSFEFFNPDFRVYADAVGAMDDVKLGATRVLGLHSDQNASAYAILFCLLVVSNFIRPLFGLILGMIAIVPIIATSSRSGILIWLVLMLMIGFSRRAGKFSVAAVLVSLLGVCGMTFMVLSGNLIDFIVVLGYEELLTQDMIARMSGNILTQEDGSSTERRALVERALNDFFSNPLLGTGLGTFHLQDTVDFNRAHNTFLQLAAELGIFGLLTYSFLFFIPLFIRSFFAFKFCVLAAIVSLFSHTILWEPWFVVSAVISIIVIPMYEKTQLRTKKVSKKGKRRRKKRKQGGGLLAQEGPSKTVADA